MDKSTASGIPKPSGLGAASGGSISSSTSSLSGTATSGMRPPTQVSKIARSCVNATPKPSLPPNTPQPVTDRQGP
ncbi:hypothetical protein M8J76_010341 [Diaphorina citri]|nr:hypothetical protein M8J75_003950 [Diaphorina citri]KAI5719451.1 hypothetical protein M8J76_010341 [Diaphorina citri]